MFRVYDKKKKEWVKNKTYLTPKGDIYVFNQSVLGWTKLSLLSQDRYVYHKNIDLTDKNGVSVYEGDYIKAQVDDNKSVVGLVAYAHELSAYVILCVDSDEFYTFGSDVSEDIEIIGNVFDGYKK